MGVRVIDGLLYGAVIFLVVLFLALMFLVPT